jgi:hypothetical protein
MPPPSASRGGYGYSYSRRTVTTRVPYVTPDCSHSALEPIPLAVCTPALLASVHRHGRDQSSSRSSASPNTNPPQPAVPICPVRTLLGTNSRCSSAKSSDIPSASGANNPYPQNFNAYTKRLNRGEYYPTYPGDMSASYPLLAVTNGQQLRSIFQSCSGSPIGYADHTSISAPVSNTASNLAEPHALE